MDTPPKYSLVAYWVEPTTYADLYRRQWEVVTTYLLLDPTGPTKKSYFAVKLGGCMDKQKTVRIQLEVPGSGMLVTQEEYRKRYAEAGKLIEQKKMWAVLTR